MLWTCSWRRPLPNHAYDIFHIFFLSTMFINGEAGTLSSYIVPVKETGTIACILSNLIGCIELETSFKWLLSVSRREVSRSANWPTPKEYSLGRGRPAQTGAGFNFLACRLRLRRFNHDHLIDKYFVNLSTHSLECRYECHCSQVPRIHFDSKYLAKLDQGVFIRFAIVHKRNFVRTCVTVDTACPENLGVIA